MRSLEYHAFFWLRWEKRCPVVLTGRSPRPHHGLPDVLGITRARYLYEIEIKRSLSDFRANEKKPFIAHRNELLQLEGQVSHPKYPKLFWYLVPPELVEKVQPILPTWAGLLRGPKMDERQCLHSVVPAPGNNASERLTVKECAQLLHVMSNEIYSLTERLAGVRQQMAWNLENQIADYEI